MRPSKLTAPEIRASIEAVSDRWRLAENGESLNGEFGFKDFVDAWTFMCRIAADAEAMDHHPEWTNVYNRVSIRLTTHEVGGLTDLDFALAKKIDQASFDSPLIPGHTKSHKC